MGDHLANLLMKIDDDHPCALSGKLQCMRAAKSAPAARYNRDPSRQLCNSHTPSP